jgi:hypothetical protein
MSPLHSEAGPKRALAGSRGVVVRSGYPGLVRMLRGALVGGTIIALVVAARSAGILHGKLALVLLVAGCLSVPVSRQLSRRILVVGTAGLGWLPMAWLIPAPFPALGRSGLLLALLLGGLGAWVASGTSTRARGASLVPHLRSVDILPVLAAIASAVVLRDLLAARTGSRVLTLLIPGYDNISHYAIVHMIRESGAMTAAPWASGVATPFSHYPQGFHAAVVAVMELLTSPSVGSTDYELVVYAHAVVIVVIVAVTALVSGICALPRLRSRPVLAAPLVALVTAGFITGPGGTALRDGFPNFVVACALMGMIVLLIIPLQRVISPVILGAMGGAVVGIAWSWALLLVFALLAMPALLMPLSRRRWEASRGQYLAAAAILMAVGVSLFVALDVLSAIQLSTQLTVGGGVTQPDIGMLFAIVAASAGLTLVVLARAWGAPAGSAARMSLRAATLAIVPLGGAVAGAAIIVLQLRATAKVSYYFWKFAIGLELSCLVVLVGAAVALVTAWPKGSATRVSRTLATVSSGILVFAASQTFGYTGPSLATYGVARGESSTRTRELALEAAKTPNPTGERLLAALHVQERDRSRSVVFLPYPSDDRTNAKLAEQWYLGLTGTYTDRSTRVVMSLTPTRSPREAGARAKLILRSDPTALVVVGPDVLNSVRASTDPAFRDRVVAW